MSKPSPYIGRKFGKLTVLEDCGTLYRCVCDCQRIVLAPKRLTQPSNAKAQAAMACDVCNGSPCEVCGKWMAGTFTKKQPTCSDRCKKERIRLRHKDKYERIKNTPEYIEQRKSYIEAIKRKRKEDPEFDRAFRAYANSLRKRQYLQWKAQAIATPGMYEAHLREVSRWYRSLSVEERERAIYEPRRRLKERKNAEAQAKAEAEAKAHAHTAPEPEPRQES
jgi:hypothetical protein